MTKNEFSLAVAMAQSDVELPALLNDVAMCELTAGYEAKSFKDIHITIAGVAQVIRHQCCQLDGGMDAVELDKIARIGRHKFMIVGMGADSARAQFEQLSAEWHDYAKSGCAC